MYINPLNVYFECKTFECKTAVAVLIVRFYGRLRWNNTGAKEQQNQLHQNGGNRIILKLL